MENSSNKIDVVDEVKAPFRKKAWCITKKLSKRWFVDSLGAMALGLFSSLIIGLIIGQLGQIPFLSFLSDFATIAKHNYVVGAAIGVAIAYGMKKAPLVIFSCAVVGAFGSDLGGPVGAYVSAVAAAEIGSLISGKTKVDIILVPLLTIISGCLVGKYIGPPISAFMSSLGTLINNATEMQPVLMGIIVSVLVGMVLTAPISSAAICIALGLEGLAAGAATVGCCANMIGFAVISYKDNKIGGLLAQGLGTSMLQVPNIVKRPMIWIPSIVASAVLGPVATTIYPLVNNAYGAGMGTSGLVGPINSYIVMTTEGINGVLSTPVQALIKIALLEFVLPAVISLLVYFLLKKIKWIRDGDMILDLGKK
ncbi:MAG: PTS sugar transporter subunit IIC [Clostridiales bacterium]|nr:PTS sugar transporter subunit IIC [Clostridiales bacterium]